MWKHHAIYESIPCSVIVTLGKQLYKILEVAMPTIIHLVSTKKCRKVISHTGKFFLFMIHSQSEWKVTMTSMASAQGFYMQHKKVDRVVEEYRDISPHLPRHL
jgi:predicted TIM-barrel fold metal-dependent hydrolase